MACKQRCYCTSVSRDDPATEKDEVLVVAEQAALEKGWKKRFKEATLSVQIIAPMVCM